MMAVTVSPHPSKNMTLLTPYPQTHYDAHRSVSYILSTPNTLLSNMHTSNEHSLAQRDMFFHSSCGNEEYLMTQTRSSWPCLHLQRSPHRLHLRVHSFQYQRRRYYFWTLSYPAGQCGPMFSTMEVFAGSFGRGLFYCLLGNRRRRSRLSR